MAQSISQESIVNTGLPGATAASRYAGSTASGAPTTGTFAVGDFIIDQTGKVYVCTVAGTPGTWVQVGGGAAAPGTTVTSYYSGRSVNANTIYGLTSVSLTAGTWLINYFLGFAGSAGGQSCVYWLGTTNASQTNVICSNQVITSSGYYTSGQGCSVYSYTVASTTTVYLNTQATAAGAILGNDNLSLTNLLTGIVAVRTA